MPGPAATQASLSVFQMPATPMIIVCETSGVARQAGFTPHNHVALIFQPNRAYQPFDVGRLLCRVGCSQHLPHAQLFHLRGEVGAENAIAISQQIARRGEVRSSVARTCSWTCTRSGGRTTSTSPKPRTGKQFTAEVLQVLPKTGARHYIKKDRQTILARPDATATSSNSHARRLRTTRGKLPLPRRRHVHRLEGIPAATDQLIPQDKTP
jgi:hypothetical protein